MQGVAQEPTRAQPVWKAILNSLQVRVVLGLMVGIAMLFLISRFIDIPTTVTVLRQHLTTRQGVIYALLATASFITAFSVRGARWRLFLCRICDISTLKAIQVFWVAVFLNFLLPVQGGEVAKSLILKRIKRVPISQSLPRPASWPVVLGTVNRRARVLRRPLCRSSIPCPRDPPRFAVP